MLKYRHILICGVTVVSFAITNAQKRLSYSFRHIGQADGLLHNDVLSIAQDGRGFIWIASVNGLQRYDGSTFVNYTDRLTNPNEGLNPGVEIFSDTKQNTLWLLGKDKIEKMQIGRSKFERYSPETSMKDPASLQMSYTGTNDDAWLIGRNALYYLDRGTKTYSFSNLSFPLSDGKRTAFKATDRTGNYTWLANFTHLYLFDKIHKKASSEETNPDGHPLLKAVALGSSDKSLRFVMIDSKDNVWVTTWGDILYKYDNASKIVSTYSLAAIKKKEDGGKTNGAGLLINCMIEDDQQNIWVGTENLGLLRYNQETDNFDYCIGQTNNTEQLQYNYKIYNIFQARESNIWIATDKGISIFNPYRQNFKTLRHDENGNNSIRKSEIVDLIQATTGDVFVSTWGGGIGVYDSALNFSKNIFFTGNPEKNQIWCLTQGDAGSLWMGCQHGFVLNYDLATGKEKTFRPAEIGGYTIRCMKKDKKGDIIFGLHNGKIVKWDNAARRFIACNETFILNAPVINMFIDAGNRCWVSTERGFKRFDLDKMVYTNVWLPRSNDPSSITANNCQGIEQLDDSTLLIGTLFGGMNLFNIRTETFSHIGVLESIPKTSIYAIRKDEAGNIWFTTDYNLYKFDIGRKTVIPFSLEPGLLNSSFSLNKFYPLRNGQWLTATTTEVVSFRPQASETREEGYLETEITGFRVFGKLLDVDSLLYSKQPVTLSYKENFITVEFAALAFSGLHQVNYTYRLIGVDKDWVRANNNRFANYTGLAPGNYTFEVKAENGGLTGELHSFAIIITPPFWKTWWFFTLASLVILMIGYLFIKWRIRNTRLIEAEKQKVNRLNAEQLRNKLELEQQLSKARLEALRSQMNPHFIFNCINSIDALIHSNDKYNATVYLNKFAKLLRNILDGSKQDTVTFSKDTDTLRLYIEMEEFRFENKFITTLDIDEELLNNGYKVPPMIIQPYVENAILHGLKNKDGNGGSLLVQITKTADHVQYIIRDNGIGRKAAALLGQNKGSHHGMQISDERIRLFNKEEKASLQIKDLYENGEAAGTEIVVNLNLT